MRNPNAGFRIRLKTQKPTHDNRRRQTAFLDKDEKQITLKKQAGSFEPILELLQARLISIFDIIFGLLENILFLLNIFR